MIVWLGKHFNFMTGIMDMVANNWMGLLACLLFLSVQYCVWRDLFRLLGRLIWAGRPSWGLPPFLSSSWSHVLWVPQHACRIPLLLLHW